MRSASQRQKSRAQHALDKTMIVERKKRLSFCELGQSEFVTALLCLHTDDCLCMLCLNRKTIYSAQHTYHASSSRLFACLRFSLKFCRLCCTLTSTLAHLHANMMASLSQSIALSSFELLAISVNGNLNKFAITLVLISLSTIHFYFTHIVIVRDRM